MRVLPYKKKFREEVFPNYTLLGIDKEKKTVKDVKGRISNAERVNDELINSLVQKLPQENVSLGLSKHLPKSSNPVLIEDAEILSVIIKHQNESESKLNTNDLTKIFELISKERLKAKDDNWRKIIANLKIKQIFLYDGRVVVECNDEYTLKWVKSLKFNQLVNRKYKILNQNEKKIKCCIRVLTRPKIYTAAEFKEQIISGNPEHKIKTLILHDTKKCEDGMSLIYFSVNRAAYESMRAKNFEIFFDCSMTRVQNVMDE